MSLLLVDTTFLIDAERSEHDLDEVVRDADDIAMAAITVAELMVGVNLASERNRARRQEYVEAVTAAIPIISYDRTIAAEHAELLVAVRRAGRPRGAHDLMIAATARATKRTVVTADLSAFDDLPGVAWISHR